MNNRTKRIEFKGELWSASALGRRFALSPPTILKRFAAGLRDDDLVATAYSHPKAEKGKGYKYRSFEVPSPLEARYRLRKAHKSYELAFARLLNAKAHGEPAKVLKALDRRLTRAEVRRMFCTELVRMADKHRQEMEEAA